MNMSQAYESARVAAKTAKTEREAIRMCVGAKAWANAAAFANPEDAAGVAAACTCARLAGKCRELGQREKADKYASF